MATRACVVDVGNFFKSWAQCKKKNCTFQEQQYFLFSWSYDIYIFVFSFKFGRSLFLRHFDEKYWNIGKFDFRYKIKGIGQLEIGKKLCAFTIWIKLDHVFRRGSKKTDNGAPSKFNLFLHDSFLLFSLLWLINRENNCFYGKYFGFVVLTQSWNYIIFLLVK